MFRYFVNIDISVRYWYVESYRIGHMNIDFFSISRYVRSPKSYIPEPHGIAGWQWSSFLYTKPSVWHQLTLWDHRLGYHEVCVFTRQLSTTGYSLRLATEGWPGWVDMGNLLHYIPEWFTHLQTVTHPSSNRAQRITTMSTETNAL